MVLCGWGMGRLDGLMMKNDQLLGPEGERGIGAALVIAELDLDDLGGERLDDRSDLAAHETSIGKILEERHDIQELELAVHGRPHIT
jgi:hypothetical protein